MPSFRKNRAFRLACVALLATRILASYKLASFHKDRLSEKEYNRRLQRAHRKNAEAIYRAVLRLQGLMIKIGQTIGSRPDIFPPEYATILSRLQDQVPPRPFTEMRPYIERQLGRPLGDVFAEFHAQPIAAASLAQVYAARLHDGRKVAVKVVYPGIDRLVKTDLRLLRAAIWAESKFYAYPLDPVYRELSENVPKEVDMISEAHHMEEITRLLRDREDVIIPGVIWEYTTRRVLTMDYVDGIKITDLEALREAGIDTIKVFTLLTEVYFHCMLNEGYFQADPHPGNLLVLPGRTARTGPRLAILDFGLSKRLTPEFRRPLKDGTRALFLGDNDGFAEGLHACGFRWEGDAREPAVALAEFFRAMSNPDTYKERDMMHAVNEAFVSTFKRHPMLVMPGDITLAMRVFGLLFGIGAVVAGDLGMPSDTIRETVLRVAGEPEAAEVLMAAG